MSIFSSGKTNENEWIGMFAEEFVTGYQVFLSKKTENSDKIASFQRWNFQNLKNYLKLLLLWVWNKLLETRHLRSLL